MALKGPPAHQENPLDVMVTPFISEPMSGSMTSAGSILQASRGAGRDPTLVRPQLGVGWDPRSEVGSLLSQMCYVCRMSEVASRELRNRTRALLDRVAAGEHITITVDGRPVATLVPPEPRQRWMLREAFATRILGHQADPGLTADLGELAPDTTDDLPL
jgi:prevent-host-death family protein